MRFLTTLILTAAILFGGIGISLDPYIPTASAESVNYTEAIEKFIDKLHPNQKHIFVVDKVNRFETDKHDEPEGSLAFWITVKFETESRKYLVLVGGGKVFAYRPLDVKFPEGVPQGSPEEEPGCSPEEHEQHHGKGKEMSGPNHPGPGPLRDMMFKDAQPRFDRGGWADKAIR